MTFIKQLSILSQIKNTTLMNVFGITINRNFIGQILIGIIIGWLIGLGISWINVFGVHRYRRFVGIQYPKGLLHGDGICTKFATDYIHPTIETAI